jgi:hypothetical protein
MIELKNCSFGIQQQGPSWSWSCGSWIYNYLCNQCLSPLTLKVRIPLRWGVLYTTLCDKVCQSLTTGQSFSLVSSTNKTDCHTKTEILLKVAFNTITLTPLNNNHSLTYLYYYSHSNNHWPGLYKQHYFYTVL